MLIPVMRLSHYGSDLPVMESDDALNSGGEAAMSPDITFAIKSSISTSIDDTSSHYRNISHFSLSSLPKGYSGLQHLKWPEVISLKFITTTECNSGLCHVSSTHGLPSTIAHDTAPNHLRPSFKAYGRCQNIIHPYVIHNQMIRHFSGRVGVNSIESFGSIPFNIPNNARSNSKYPHLISVETLIGRKPRVIHNALSAKEPPFLSSSSCEEKTPATGTTAYICNEAFIGLNDVEDCSEMEDVQA
nr:hypothetical protein HmN_000604100 [Hymenolepis microstoma]